MSAICTVPELSLREFTPTLHAIKSDPNALIQEAAQRLLSQFGEDNSMNTLKTVSILERNLLLREIPIFADLSPEDLELIAENTQEE